MTLILEIGSNLRWLGLAALVAALVVQWWGFRARRRD